MLSFRVAQTNDASNPVAGGQDFQIELVGGGEVKATYASRFDDIPQPYDRKFQNPSTGVITDSIDKNVMTVVRIPLQSFIMNRSGVTLDAIDTIRFTFNSPPGGQVYVDDIEFSR